MTMFKNKKLLATVAVAALAFPVGAFATDTTMDATATFLAAITLTPTNMDFSKVDYSGTPVAGSFVKLGTNGAATYAGVLSANAGATPAAGTVTVNTGTAGQIVDISCDTTASMKDAGTGTLGIIATEVTTGAGVAFQAVGSFPCAGVGTASTTKVLAGADVFKFGGEIDGGTQAGAWVGGAYTTVGATPLNIRVTYQ